MAQDNASYGQIATLTHRLGRTRLAVRLAMVAERLWPRLVPALAVTGLFLIFAWFGLFRQMPDMARLGLVGIFGLAFLASLWPLRYFRAPSPAEIDHRIEAANHLLHRPVSVQTDAIAQSDDAFAAALWREHQKRMGARLGALHGDSPRTRLAERDPWGLRAAVALMLVVAFAFSLGPLGGRISDAFSGRALAETVPARIDAWITPPAYTGRAPVFLTADANQAQQVFTIPEGSEFALRITGGSGEERLAFLDGDGNARDVELAQNTEGAAPVPASAGSTGARQFAMKVTEDGTVRLTEGDEALRDWSFGVTPDAPPVIRFTGDPTRAANGTLDLAYEIEDDYGPARADALFSLDEASGPDARPLYDAPEMPLALPRGKQSIAARTTRDLTEHPWAGSMVTVRLKVTDQAGQEGFSEAKTFVLPERVFTKQLAKAVIEHRRMIALDANQVGAVRNLIDSLTLRPEDTFDQLSHYLGLMAGRTRLNLASTDDALRDVADYFWDMALAIEDGALSSAEQRLRQAQEALRDALENGASDEEIEKLMAELREAMNEYLREFAERAMRDPNMAQQMPQDGQQLSQRDLDQMLDQIEELAKSGSRDQAQELLSQLENMMNNLQAGRSQQGQQGGQQSEMRQQMDKLGEIMRQQQEMMNETHRLDQMQRGQQGQRGQGQQGQGQQGQGQQGQGQQGEGQQPGQGMSPQEFADAMRQLQQRQGQLQSELDQLMQRLDDMGIKPGEGFGQAGEAMGEAEGALGQNQGERAVGEQGRALEALRQGAQDMMNQMQAMQGQEGQDGMGDRGQRQQSADRDPLGRPRATTGPDFGNQVEVPDEIDTQRARQILEAIRKRLGDALSPELEKQYLERLLELR